MTFDVGAIKMDNIKIKESMLIRTPEQQREKLNQQIVKYIFSGYVLVNRTEFTASLKNPEVFNFMIFVLCLLYLVFPGIL